MSDNLDRVLFLLPIDTLAHRIVEALCERPEHEWELTLQETLRNEEDANDSPRATRAD